MASVRLAQLRAKEETKRKAALPEAAGTILAGPLLKKSRYGTWQKRHFVLSESKCLAYYAEKGDAAPRGEVDLRGAGEGRKVRQSRTESPFLNPNRTPEKGDHTVS